MALAQILMGASHGQPLLLNVLNFGTSELRKTEILSLRHGAVKAACTVVRHI